MSELKPLYSVEETLRIQTVKLNQQLNKLLEQNTQIIELTSQRDNALAQNAELVKSTIDEVFHNLFYSASSPIPARKVYEAEQWYHQRFQSDKKQVEK